MCARTNPFFLKSFLLSILSQQQEKKQPYFGVGHSLNTHDRMSLSIEMEDRIAQSKGFFFLADLDFYGYLRKHLLKVGKTLKRET